MKPATHAYYIPIRRDSGDKYYEVYIPAMTKLGYRVHYYTDLEAARDITQKWNDENLRIGGYRG